MRTSVCISTCTERLFDLRCNVEGSGAKQQLVLSMAAGVDTAKLECWLGDSFRVIRAMPNTPVEVNTASYAA
jgi:pyrroline-5-carboxylate reductase